MSNDYIIINTGKRGRPVQYSPSGRASRPDLMVWPELKLTGHKYYFTGIPCKRGHIDKRNHRGECMSCNLLSSMAYKETPTGWDNHLRHMREYQKRLHDNA